MQKRSPLSIAHGSLFPESRNNVISSVMGERGF